MKGQICKNLIYYDVIVLLLWIDSDSEDSCQQRVCTVCVCYLVGGVICCSFWFDSMMSSWASGCTSAVQPVTSDTNVK